MNSTGVATDLIAVVGKGRIFHSTQNEVWSLPEEETKLHSERGCEIAHLTSHARWIQDSLFFLCLKSNVGHCPLGVSTTNNGQQSRIQISDMTTEGLHDNIRVTKPCEMIIHNRHVAKSQIIMLSCGCHLGFRVTLPLNAEIINSNVQVVPSGMHSCTTTTWRQTLTAWLRFCAWFACRLGTGATEGSRLQFSLACSAMQLRYSASMLSAGAATTQVSGAYCLCGLTKSLNTQKHPA